MMQHKKKILMCLSFLCKQTCATTPLIKYEMIGIATDLLVLIILITVLIIHANNKYSG